MPEFTLFHLLQCCLFFGIGFLASLWFQLPRGIKRKLVEEDATTHDAPPPAPGEPPELEETINCVVDRVQGLADGMLTDVHQHSESVAQINSDLVTISSMADVEGVARVISRLMEANRHLDSRLNVAEAKLLEQSQQLRSHRVEARTDALTGLPNRRVFDEELQRLFDERRIFKKPASLIMIDIDHFKDFNDRYGHQAGDTCLKAVGGVIREAVQPMGGIVVRYGGEEFAILFPNTEIFEAKIAAQRVNYKIDRMSVDCGKASHSVTASLGVAELFQDIKPEDWLGRADRALYDAKRRGRNRACWNDSHGCHEIAKDLYVTLCDPAEEDAATSLVRREEFLRDVDRRLAMFHRKKQPIGMIMASIDPIDPAVQDEVDPREIEDAVQAALQDVLRDMDHVCLLAENQFGALLPTASVVEAALVADRAREGVSQLRFETSQGVAHATLTCGVTEAKEGDDAFRLVARAESCLRHVGKAGGNAVYMVREECEWETPQRLGGDAVIAP
ncbi:GGDEF domain-containing protein [Blastopirellula marina]|nr:GGDEF domain-containing protein [Blastopirellula marina]